MEHVEGDKKGSVVLYALSTCAWCRKTKQLLDRIGVEYDYVYVDQLKGAEEDKIMDDVERWNPKCSFPTMIINNKECIVGFNEKKIRKALGNGDG